jgi:hypothetical protein
VRATKLRGLDLLLETPAIPVVRLGTRGQFSVASSRGGMRRYIVNLGQDPPSCTCPWSRSRQARELDSTCKHAQAARLAIRALSRRRSFDAVHARRGLAVY